MEETCTSTLPQQLSDCVNNDADSEESDKECDVNGTTCNVNGFIIRSLQRDQHPQAKHIVRVISASISESEKQTETIDHNSLSSIKLVPVIMWKCFESDDDYGNCLPIILEYISDTQIKHLVTEATVHVTISTKATCTI